MEFDQRKADSQACEFRNFRRRRKALLQLKASCSLDDENYPRRRKTKSTNYREMSSMLVLSNENASSSEIVAADGQMCSSCEETTRSSEEEEEEKENNNNSNVLTKLKCGSVSMMGRRRTMEDTFTMVPEIVTGRFSFFAVYDGHGGAGVANACRDRLHKLLEDDLATILSEGTEATGGDNWTAIMKTCFSKMDDEVILKDEVDGAMILGEKSGSTATVVVVGVEEMVVANCGDSRAVLCRGGIAVPLSTDHKSNRPDEVERVEAAGGVIVDWNGCRVEGVLAISRSIGHQCSENAFFFTWGWGALSLT